MNYIEPTGDQIKQLLSLPDDGPVVMVNLLKFKPDGGAESYAEYAKAAMPFLGAAGATLVYRGEYRMPLIGDGDWDEILLVEYPSISAFLKMAGDEGYRAIIHHRTEALIDSRLWATKQE